MNKLVFKDIEAALKWAEGKRDAFEAMGINTAMEDRIVAALRNCDVWKPDQPHVICIRFENSGTSDGRVFSQIYSIEPIMILG